MNGPQHYQEAERLLAFLDTPAGRSIGGEVDTVISQAQVHATLALTAATVECASDLTPPQEFAGNGNYITQGTNAKAWQEALS